MKGNEPGFAAAALVVLLVVLFISSCSGGKVDPAALERGRTEFERACSACHPLSIPLSKIRTPKEWKETVRKMREKGADLNDATEREVAAFLAATRGR